MALRDLVTEALEILEVDFRAVIAYEFGQRHGAFGHIDATTFFGSFHHANWLLRLQEEADRSSELFVEHFRNNYAQFPDLPIWMAMEVMSFGALSKMFQGMIRGDQRPVARRYGVQPRDLVAIFHHLVYLRNLCAHHSRLWDRVWAIKPSLPRGTVWQPPHLPSNDRLFASLLLLYHLMKSCPAVAGLVEEWRDRLKQHLSQPPAAVNSLNKMGMPPNWENHPVWT
jgi:abortive infection bacteriophage resistance protein